MKKIKSIDKGTGEGSTYFAVNDKYQYAICGDRIHNIEEEIKILGKGLHNDLTLTVYRGYDVAGQLLFEIESNSSLTINYETGAVAGV